MAKQVMLSQPPSGSASSGISGSGTSMGTGPSIGNYKGVMLCNRPFAGVQAAANAAASNSNGRTAAFRAGIPDGRGTLGLNPTKKLLPHAKPKKRITAVARHKRWLTDLQSQKRVLEDEILADEDEKERRKARFSERERVKRQVVNERNVSSEEISSKYSDEEGGGKVAENESKMGGISDEEFVSDEQNKKIKQRQKPAWAYTEESKKQEEEDLEEEELQELLDFTNNLDFEDFIEDLEVKNALETLRKRVAELTPRDGEGTRERMQRALLGKDIDNGVLEKAGLKVLRPLTEETLEQLQKAIDANGDSGKESKFDDGASVMSESSILSDAKSLRSVHSARSIAAIRRQIESKNGGGLSALDVIREEPVDLPYCPEPVLVVIKEDGDRLANKFEPSRLPYIRRNPAV